MATLTSRNIKYLITAVLFVIFILPQLNDVHYDPLPQFWAEATTAWAAISLFLIICFSSKSMSIPKITLPLLLLALYTILQPQLVHISFPGLSYIGAMEFFICILLAIAVSTIVNNYGLAWTITIFAQALVAGAMLQSTIGFIQYTGHYKIFGNFIFYDSSHPTTNIFGHFGQRNHYCHYLSWAVFGLIYLYLNNKILRTNFYTILLWFMFSITIAASRSVFIYFALALIISGTYFGFKRDLSSRKLFFIMLISTLALIAFEYGYPIVQSISHDHSNIQSGFQRLANTASDNGTGRRFVEWQKAWMTFKTHPIFGYGLNEYSHQSVFLQPFFKHTPTNDGLFTNCHNLILQFMAETGIIGTAIIVFGSIWSLYGLIKRISLEIIIILCMIATTFAHSMVEYPLWYFYFLCPLIMFMSLDKPLFDFKSSSIAAIVSMPLALIVYLLITSSILFNTLVNYIDIPNNKAAFISQGRYLEKLVNNNIIWAYPAMYVLDNYITINNISTNSLFDVNTQLKYENLFTNSHPYPDNLIKLSMLNWNLGNVTLAHQYAILAISAFPVYKRSFLTTLKDKKYKELKDLIQNYKE